MARSRRILHEGALYHVMARGNRRKLFRGIQDRLRFMELLGETQVRYGIRWRAFTLMTSHYHGAAQTPTANLSDAMRYLNGQYAQWWNRRHRTSGHLFGERFVSKPIEDERYAYTALKYIVWNPVEGGYVSHPDEWVWSSHRATAGLATPPEFLDLTWLLAAFGGRTLAEAQRQYWEAMNEAPSKGEVATYLKEIVVGSPFFQEELRSQIGVTMHDLRVPRSYRALARPSLGQLFASCREDLEERNRTIRRAQVVYGYRQSEIARSLNLHPNTVSKIVSGLAKQRFWLARVE